MTLINKCIHVTCIYMKAYILVQTCHDHIKLLAAGMY